jgi:formylglycine-generating enzyme required for sulfatase activity
VKRGGLLSIADIEQFNIAESVRHVIMKGPVFIRRVKLLFILSVLTAGVLLNSFSSRKSEADKLPKPYNKLFAYIPSGVVVAEGINDTVRSFYMARNEVTNREYREFLGDLKSKGLKDQYLAALWDTAGWRQGMAFNEPYVIYYHSHPAYDLYPVVNVPFEGAHLYCRWLQDKLNAAWSSESETCSVRLPTRIEWLLAANGGHKRPVYSWGGHLLRNAKGIALCNFVRKGDECIQYNRETATYEVVRNCAGDQMGVAGYLSDNADITAPVHSYAPNDFGIYNVNGNVAEMVDDKGVAVGGSWRCPGYDVRNESIMAYSAPSPEIGFRPIVTISPKR